MLFSLVGNLIFLPFVEIDPEIKNITEFINISCSSEYEDRYLDLKQDYKFLESDYVDAKIYYELRKDQIKLEWTGCNDLREKYQLRTVACTGSMRPTISCHNKITMCKPLLREILIGDIIEFESPYQRKHYTIHRIINITENGLYQTKGDAALYPDSFLVNFSQIAGKVDMIE